MMTEMFETYSRFATQNCMAALDATYKIADQNEKLILQAIDMNRQAREQSMKMIQEMMTRAIEQQKVAVERMTEQQKQLADRMAHEVRESQKKATELIENATKLLNTTTNTKK